MEKEYRGISFPFRIGVKGGVVMSSTMVSDVTHIVESMEQIVRTKPMERCMEYQIKSDIDTLIFSPNDASARTLIAYEVETALAELENRIEVKSVDVTSDGNVVYANVTFKVIAYDSTYSAQLKVGEVSNVQNTNSGYRLYK